MNFHMSQILPVVKCVELSLVAVYTVTYRFRSPKILAALSQGQKRRKCLKWENIVFRKWKIYVIICNPRASSKTAEHRLDRASIAEPDMSKRGARAICRRGNVVHEFTASIMNLPPTNAPHLITDDVRRCGFIPSPFSSRKALGVNAGVTLLIFFSLVCFAYRWNGGKQRRVGKEILRGLFWIEGLANP